MNKYLSSLREKAARLPLTPGVYLMKNASGEIIYVGKSRKLKNRVSSYFLGEHTGKTARMVDAVADFDYIVCKTEMEALTLENVLIKRHTPHYNIRLKDCKSYPYIKIGTGDYPRVTVTRERRDDGARYFGPYRGISDAYAAVGEVAKIFGLPTCKRVFPRDIGKERPCLYLQMGRCAGVCTGNVSKEDYAERLRGAREVLAGGIAPAVASLTERMTAHAEKEEFEEAARLRDSIESLRRLREKQTVVGDASLSADVLAICDGVAGSALAILTVRDGVLIAKNEFVFPPSGILDAHAALSFLVSYYSDADAIPGDVLLAFPADDEEKSDLADYLSARRGKKVTVRTPERGTAKHLCALAEANAQERIAREAEEKKKDEGVLLSLARHLALEVLPERIEAYDISNVGDECITASMVVFTNGKPDKSAYRSFSIRSTDGANDYGAMYEVLTRRLSHIGDGTPSLGEAPDLILVDGGREHVRVGLRALADGARAIPLYGMVKDDYHKTRALTDGDAEIHIAADQTVYVLIYRIQEEAHRFAVRHTMGEKRRTLRHSSLEAIDGIGPAKAKRLLASFGSLRALAGAAPEEIARVRGISRSDASKVYTYFHKGDDAT